MCLILSINGDLILLLIQNHFLNTLECCATIFFKTIIKIDWIWDNEKDIWIA